MSIAEKMALIAWLFALLATFSFIRESPSADRLFRRPILHAVVAVFALGNMIGSPIEFRAGILTLFATIGATEIGYWMGQALHIIFPQRTETGPRDWTIRKDPAGCGITILISLALLYFGLDTVSVD